MKQYAKLLQKHNFVRTVQGGTDEDGPIPGTYFILRFEGDKQLALTIAHDELGAPWIAFGTVTLSQHGFTKQAVSPLGDDKVYRACLAH